MMRWEDYSPEQSQEKKGERKVGGVNKPTGWQQRVEERHTKENTAMFIQVQSSGRKG